MSEDYTRLPIHHSACNELYYKVQECEISHPIARLFGKCSDAHVALSKCIRQNKQTNAALNSEKSRLRQEKFKEKLRAEKASNET